MMKSMTAYDAVAYPGHPYPHTHPDNLATLARLHGMAPALSDRCRVLELACGDGANLIPLALVLPESQFLGIDLAQAPILRGQDLISQLGLLNIRLEAMDLMDFSPDAGSYDYIIAHGLYSWVPPAVQKRIMEVVAQALAPQGVAFISYNTMPGGHIRMMMREMMLFHSRKFEEPDEMVRQARSLVQLAAGSQNFPNRYGFLLQREWEEDLSIRHPQALFHDELGECNSNLYFHEFMARAADQRLQFLCEAAYDEMQANGIKPEIKEMLKGLGDDVIAREQYIDFLVGRRFRQTLLCHASVPLDRSMSSEHVKQFSIASNARPEQPLSETAPDGDIKFVGPKDVSIISTHPLLTAALVCLDEHWPMPLGFEVLREMARKQLAAWGLASAAQPEHEAALTRALMNCYGLGLVDLCSWLPPLSAKPGACPVASPLARLQSRSGKMVTTLLHTSVELTDSLARTLLQLLDGTRDRAAIAKELAQAALMIDDTPCHDPQVILQTIHEELESHLTSLARLGLLCREENSDNNNAD